eukprot:467343-Alexandrium_andersonii.AAC.1
MSGPQVLVPLFGPGLAIPRRPKGITKPSPSRKARGGGTPSGHAPSRAAAPAPVRQCPLYSSMSAFQQP